MLRVGEESPIPGFRVVAAIEGDPGRFELCYTIDAGTFVHFTASTEESVLAQAASWIAEQAKRADGGALGKSRPAVKVSRKAPEPKPKPKGKNVVEA